MNQYMLQQTSFVFINNECKNNKTIAKVLAVEEHKLSSGLTAPFYTNIVILFLYTYIENMMTVGY